MRYAWTILTMMFMITALLACQPAEGSTLPQNPVAQTNSPGSLPESSATQSSETTLPTEVPNMTPATPPDEASAKMVMLVAQHLAKNLGITADQIVLSEVKPVVWRDAGLGCPKPGVDYIQVQTPGYNIRLETGGKTYNYHTDATKRFVLCGR
jgi:hypothetical protein